MEVAARSDWSARVRTRGIDGLGTTHSRARTHARVVFVERFYYVVADAHVISLVTCRFPRGFQ